MSSRSCSTAHRDTELTDLAQMKLGTMPGLIERFNGQHIISLTANVHGITLGEASQKLNQAIAGAGAPPRGVKVVMKGQIPPLEQTISGLRIGLLLAVVVIFLLLSANFQSMRLAFAIVLTVPAVLCGVLLMLRITGSTLNIQSFMGAIMAIGIAVANSILLITFAERFRHDKRPVMDAAREGASSRLRAILMTAAAMIFGMLPMAIGFGEGGSQSAPLGRAVIGGLIVSTFATLTILPSIYAILQAESVTYFSLTQSAWTLRADTMMRNKSVLLPIGILGLLASLRPGANRRVGSCRIQTRVPNRRTAGRVSALPDRIVARKGCGVRGTSSGGPRQPRQTRRLAGGIERS